MNVYNMKELMSFSAWLSKDEDPLMTQINQRITDVTGLDLETAEELQVQILMPN